MRTLLVDWEGERAFQKTFHAEGLPLVTADRDDLFVPMAALVRVFERAAKATARRDFGLRVGERLQPQSYGLWMQYCAQAPTLGEALRRIGDVLHFHQSGSRSRLVAEGAFVIWRYERSQPNKTHTQHSDHAVPAMLSLIRLYVGAEWAPSWIELDYPRDADAGIVEPLMPGPVRFGQPAVGIAVPIALISKQRPQRIGKRITPLDLEIQDVLPVTDEPLRSIFAISVLRLMDGRTDIDGTAAMAGISVRTLQRHLNREGLSYRSLLERVRLTRARALLEHTDLTITEVALTLGYSEHANFTRAFSRAAGLSPVQFRHHMRWINGNKDPS